MNSCHFQSIFSWMDSCQAFKLMKQRFRVIKSKYPREINLCYPNGLTFPQRHSNLIIYFEKHNYTKIQNLIYRQVFIFSSIMHVNKSWSTFSSGYWTCFVTKQIPNSSWFIKLGISSVAIFSSYRCFLHSAFILSLHITCTLVNNHVYMFCKSWNLT